MSESDQRNGRDTRMELIQAIETGDTERLNELLDELSARDAASLGRLFQHGSEGVIAENADDERAAVLGERLVRELHEVGEAG